MAFKKGYTPWNKGKKVPEHSLRMKGRRVSPKTEFKAGRPAPKTAFKKGQKTWAEGKKFSEAHIEKLRVSHTGKKQSEATRRKRMESISGEKNYNWKGGMTPLMFLIRRCFKYRQWVSDCYERDDFTCQECFIRGGNLHCHHLKTFSSIFYENEIRNIEEALACEEFWNINNGQTLCEECHRKTTTYGKH